MACAFQELLRRRRELLQLVSSQHLGQLITLARGTRELSAPVLNLIAALVSRPVAPPEAFVADFDSREGARPTTLRAYNACQMLEC